MEDQPPLWFVEAVELFKDTDKDGNGFLSLAEQRAVFDANDQQLLAGDLNGDALLDENEFVGMVRRQVGDLQAMTTAMNG